MEEGTWLDRAKSALRQSAEDDDPDSARILCYTNRTLERLVPHVRRAIHGEMADQLPVLPGEVLISRAAVMAPSSRDGAQHGEEPDIVCPRGVGGRGNPRAGTGGTLGDRWWYQPFKSLYKNPLDNPVGYLVREKSNV